MTDIYSLLKINKDFLKDFPLLANRVADHQTEKVIHKNMSRLRQIEDNHSAQKGINVPIQSIDEVIKKVRLYANQKDENYSSETWTFRELRIVSYYLMKFRNNSSHYQYAITLLDKNWKNIYFNGLVFYLINSWHSIEPEYREMTSQLLVRKLQQYSDNNKRYLALKKHLNFLEPTGPLRMAALLKQRNINVIDAPTILGYKPAALQNSYYSDVIVQYFKDVRITNYEILNEIFAIHNFDRTRKLLLANLIDIENRHHSGLQRSKLCRYINVTLGDVTLASTWAPFLGATQQEAEQLKFAMKTANRWFAQQIIETFFDICVQDKDRKNFWLQYVNIIDGFKIIGSSIIKTQLRCNEKIGELFSKHFIVTKSQASQTAALVLFIKNKMIVEFSDTGALYVYKKGDAMIQLVLNKARSISSTNDLKRPYMNNLIFTSEWGGYIYYEEGRMTHQGHWESRLRGWMEQKVVSSKATTTFFDEKENALFKSTPLPEEKEISYQQPQTTEPKTNQSNNKRNTPNQKEQSDLTRQQTTSTLLPIGNKPQLKENPSHPSLSNAKTIEYLKNVDYNTSSKWIDDQTNMKIVANYTGFYLFHATKGQFVLLKRHEGKTQGIGNIWIKKSNIPDWFSIVHFYMGTETTIGYFKNIFNGISFKEDLSIHDRTKIIFH